MGPLLYAVRIGPGPFTGIALALFGVVKGRLTGINMARSALQTVLVCGLAAGGCGFLFGLTTWDERHHPEALCGSTGKVRRGIAPKPDIAHAGNIRSNALKDLKRPTASLASCEP
jgi:hypothetical protein